MSMVKYEKLHCGRGHVRPRNSEFGVFGLWGPPSGSLTGVNSRRRSSERDVFDRRSGQLSGRIWVGGRLGARNRLNPGVNCR